MYRYILKRLLLFIPTLILVSCLTFFLSKQVPSDQVATLLQMRGLDDSSENFNREYYALQKKMNLDLPEFYFSIQPSYVTPLNSNSYDPHERIFVSQFSILKYHTAYINLLLYQINQVGEPTRKKLLYSVDIDQLREKTSTNSRNIPMEVATNLTRLMDDNSNQKITWHYPVLRYNGINNQYHHWVSRVFRGDFGVSLIDARPVTDKLWDAMKWSILLLALNLFFALLFAFPIGVYNGTHPNSKFDNISNSVLFAFFAIPKFWIATLMIIFFTSSEYGAWTNIFPSAGRWYFDGVDGFFSMLAVSWPKLILPVIILVIPDVAYLARLIRSNVQEESNKEYVKTAMSKGLDFKDITIRHIVPNSLIPTLTLLVGSLPGAMASGLVIEVIFNIPGVGRLMFESIESADWAMVYPIVLIISVLAVLLFLLGDLIMAYLNPKIKLG